MTIKEAKIQIKQLENDIDLLNNKKNIEFAKTQPQSSKFDKIMTDGFKNIDKNFNYVSKIIEIENQIDENIYLKSILENWVKKEMSIICEIEPIKAKIITLKDEFGLTWDNISQATNYSTKQCQRIYKEYTSHRLYEEKKEN